MPRGATVSDLHLFSHHSHYRRYFRQIERTAAEVEVFVLNGDIFDFKWSRHGIFSRSVLAASHFLEDLCLPNPQCRFIVILGNHDAVRPWMKALDQLQSDLPNLEWHEFAHRMGDRLFLHGDVIHAGSSNAGLRRFRARLRKPANGHSLQRFAHGAVHRSRVPWMAFRLLPKRVLAARVLAYLRNENWLQNGNIRHIYFGHTHADFQDFHYKNFTFHNCGSATRGGRLRIVDFPVAPRPSHEK
ncbi:MAG: hypothetical protein GVY10_02765 [Verrucomicrobia bacterium]|nr:hypothetical protein [Verrucomicrobiota bacterium]